jgi:predicted phosphodiesterase
MKKALYITDIHDYDNQVEELISMYKPDLILDGGDHEDHFYENKEIPWYFIHGNHENVEEMDNVSNQVYKNLHWLKPGEILTIGGVNLTGLGGNYSVGALDGSKKKPRPFNISNSDLANIEIMPNRKTIDILLMHESSKELWDDTSYPFGQELHSEVVRMFPNVKYTLSGHYHVPQDKLIGKNRQISLNTPEYYNHILFGFENKKIEILDMENNFFGEDINKSKKHI